MCISRQAGSAETALQIPLLAVAWRRHWASLKFLKLDSRSPMPNPHSPLPDARCPMLDAQLPISNPEASIPFQRETGTTQKKTYPKEFLYFPVLDDGQQRKIIRKASEQLWKSQRRVAGQRCNNVGSAVSGCPLALDMHPLLVERCE